MKAVITDHARRQAEELPEKSDFWFRIKRRKENAHKMCWQESKDHRGGLTNGNHWTNTLCFLDSEQT